MNDAIPPAAHPPLPGAADSAAPAAGAAGVAADQPPPAAAGTEPLATLRRRAGRRLAVLSLLGAVMVVLPLVQVLRYQNAEEAALIAERAGLDPVTRAVDVQRSLLAHRDISTLVLHGRREQEPERKVRQGEVDDRVGALALTLASGQWQRAVQESDALRDDWGLLARQVGARSINADESEQAHRLLVEQTLQVIDIVADVMAPRSGVPPGAAVAGVALPTWTHLFNDNPPPADQDAGRVQAALSAAHALPRLAWQMALLLPPAHARAGNAAMPRNDLAAAEAGLARTLGALNAALAQHPRPTLAAAGAAAGVAADSYFQALRSPAASTGSNTGTNTGNNTGNNDLRRSAAQALQAQFELFQYAHDEAANGLATQIEAVQAQRNHWLTGMAALAVVWLAVLLGTVRTLRTPAAPPPQTRAAMPAASVGPAEHERGEAARLLQRLRQGDEPHAWAGARLGITNKAARGDAAQPTLPDGL